MGNLVKVKIDNTVIWMEAEEIIAEMVPRRMRVESKPEDEWDTASNLHSTIRAYSTSLVQSFQSISSEHRPKKIIAEFGLKLSEDSKFYVVNAAGEGSLKITAEWEMK